MRQIIVKADEQMITAILCLLSYTPDDFESCTLVTELPHVKLTIITEYHDE